MARQLNKNKGNDLNRKKNKVKSAQFVKLKPAGYPLRLSLEDKSNSINIMTDDLKLFGHYATSQWNGIQIKKGEYLFDSLIFPDFAFKILDIFPNPGEITKKTRFTLVNNDITPIKEIKKPKIKFDDIIGQEEAKLKAKIVLNFLNDKNILDSEWSPKNILFYGPPGTGKTMLAKAISFQANVPIFPIKASELIGIFVGEGSKKVQNLFNQARKKTPSIIFIDELDAIALKRNYQQIRGDVIEIVSSLLGEMDGINDSNDGIITIAATNIPEEIDNAIISRFEEAIEFKLPSKEDRMNILREKSETAPIHFEVNWEIIASKTDNWSGRQLIQSLLKAALHKAIINKKNVITTADLEEIIQKKSTEKIPRFYT